MPNSLVFWLKQYAWSLNLIVAGIAFWYYRREGHLDRGLAIPFLIGSVPMAAIGGYLQVGGFVYDVLLSLVLVFAAWRLLWSSLDEKEVVRPGVYIAVASGGGIGFASGMIGIGGGIFLSPLLILRGWGNAKEAAAVAAVFTDVPENAMPAGTADLQITYLRQASGDYLDAVAEVVKRGRQLCTIQVAIVNPEGVTCCVGRVLYALRPS